LLHLSKKLIKLTTPKIGPISIFGAFFGAFLEHFWGFVVIGYGWFGRLKGIPNSLGMHLLDSI